MKLNRLIIGLLSICFVASCDESAFLKEEPLDFLGLENAYKSYDEQPSMVFMPRYGLISIIVISFFS